MSPNFGKIDPRLLEKFVYPNVGAHRSEVLIGPRFGVDNAIIRIARGKVMAVKTDPISLIPKLGIKESAWLSVHNLASDITTSGFPPTYAAFDFNLPPSMRDRDFRSYWTSLQKELGQMGATIVAGHTGRFEGCNYTIIGGGTLMAVGREDRFLTSEMAQVGDRLIATKSIALSAAAILARIFPETVEKKLGTKLVRSISKLFHDISTLRDALALVTIGVRNDGISALHDATEGGILAAIFELLSASEVGGVIDTSSFPIGGDVQQLCEAFGLDPRVTLSEGCLVAAVRPSMTADAMGALNRIGINCSEVGRIVSKSKGMKFRIGDGEIALNYPRVDPYWSVYRRGIRAGWN